MSPEYMTRQRKRVISAREARHLAEEEPAGVDADDVKD